MNWRLRILQDLGVGSKENLRILILWYSMRSIEKKYLAFVNLHPGIKTSFLGFLMGLVKEDSSPLTRVLKRGCLFYRWVNFGELLDSDEPRRLERD